MKILIVDDEVLASSRLKRLLENENIKDITVANDPKDAIYISKREKFDVAFLDISMPYINGLELANFILGDNPQCYIIFQTAYAEYALEAFQGGGMDYLLKPISEEKIKKTIQKISKYITVQNISEKKIIAKYGNRLFLLDINDIYYIEADLDEVIVRFRDGDGYVKRKISDMEQFLKNKNFFRIHRSCIINLDKVKSYETIEQSRLKIYFHNIPNSVISSKEGAKALREFLENNTI